MALLSRSPFISRSCLATVVGWPGFAALLLLLAWAPARATTVSFHDVDGDVGAIIGGTNTCDSDGANGDDTSGFSISAGAVCGELTADATLVQGALAPNGYTVSGSSAAFTPSDHSGFGQVGASGSAQSIISVSVLETTTFELDFTYDSFLNPNGNGSQQVKLIIDDLSLATPDDPLSLTFSGVAGNEVLVLELTPGNYRIIASSNTHAAGAMSGFDAAHGDGDFTLAVAVVLVPEPSAFLLLGFALLHLGARRKSR